MKRTHLIPLLILLISAALVLESTMPASLHATGSTRIFYPLIHLETTIPTTASWIGPGGGAITDLVFYPYSPYPVFAATSGGGFYRSTDGGLTWQKANTGLASLDLTAIDAAPSIPQTLYAGTYRGGIYKSTNQGTSWTEIGDGIQDYAITYAVAVDPRNANLVYLSTRGQSNNGGPPWNGIIYRTTNGGGSWSAVLSNVGGTSQEDWAYDLAVQPSDPYSIFAATHEHGAYRSTDYGLNWGAINNGVTNMSARTIEPDSEEAYPGKVYLGVFTKTGLFKSYNGGNLWSLVSQVIEDVRIYKLSLDPNDTDNIYLATFDHGVMKSSDGGYHWSTAGMGGEIILDVVVHPGSPNILLSGTMNNGLWRSTNRGTSWTHSQSGLNASTVSSIAIQVGGAQILHTSLNPGWVQRSTNGGETWSDFHTGLGDRDVTALVLHPTDPQVLYALTESAGLYKRHTTHDSSWVSIGSGLPSADAGSKSGISDPDSYRAFWADYLPGVPLGNPDEAPLLAKAPLLAMAFAPDFQWTAYLGTDGGGVYKSTNLGTSWSPIGLNGLTVRCLVVAPDNPKKIFACTNGAGSIRWTSNAGSSWNSLALPAGTAYDLAIPTTRPEAVYAATDAGVYKYKDGWTSSGLNGLHITAVAVHPGNANLLYAGTTGGAYFSTDGGTSWQAGPAELEGVWVRSIQIDPNDPAVVYFTTNGHGVLRLSP